MFEGGEELISKMYKLLLEWETKDEMVKLVMIKWAKDLGHNIEMNGESCGK